MVVVFCWCIGGVVGGDGGSVLNGVLLMFLVV